MYTRNKRLGPWDSLGSIIEAIDGLENTNVKCTWFESVASGLAGTITPPAGGTILLNEWAAGVDVLVSKIDTGVPTFEPVLDDEGAVITGTLDASGNWTISGTPADGYPISLVYVYRVALEDFNSVYCLSAAQIEGIDTLSFLGGLADELTGFPDGYRGQSTLAFVNGTRTLTLTPSGDKFSVWILGKEFVYTSAESIVITDTAGIHWIYFDEDGAIQEAVNPNEAAEESLIKRNALIAYVLWDGSAEIIFADERHGLTMDGATHYYLHEIMGYRFYEGLLIGNVDADASGDNATSAYFSMTDGTLFDEDIKHETADAAQVLTLPAQIPVYYIDGVAGTWKKDTADDYPVKNFVGGSSLLAYNSYSAPNYSQTEVTTNQYVLAHIFATNDIDEPIIAIQGQADYVSLSGARTGINTEILALQVLGLPAQEFTPLYSLIYQTSTTYGNAVQARIRTTEDGDDYIDWRYQSVAGSSGGGGSGDVVGPASAVDDGLVTFDGATGKVIQDSGLTAIAGVIAGGASPLELTSPIINTILTATGKTGAVFTEDGTCEIYFNELKMLETIAKGIKVSGHIEIEKLPADDTASGITMTADVDTNTIGIGGVLLLGADGSFDDADASAEATADGMIVMACAAGTGNTILLLQGTFQDAGAWAWTPGATLYLSETAGSLTATAPTTSGAIVRIMGFALTADSIYFDPDKTYAEV